MKNKSQSIIKNAILVANTLIGCRETSPNRSVEIDPIQKYLGFIGLPYCVIFVLYCYKLACKINKTEFPLPVTASSQTLFEWAKKKGFTYTDPQLIKQGDIVIWRKWKLWQGHAGLIASQLYGSDKGAKFETIEGNTSNSDFGSQRDGDGIYRRIRYANKIDFSVDGFYLRGFIDMQRVLGG